nr:hypothetical protein [uncultured Holophaga sp.]
MALRQGQTAAMEAGLDQLRVEEIEDEIGEARQAFKGWKHGA